MAMAHFFILFPVGLQSTLKNTLCTNLADSKQKWNLTADNQEREREIEVEYNVLFLVVRIRTQTLLSGLEGVEIPENTRRIIHGLCGSQYLCV